MMVNGEWDGRTYPNAKHMSKDEKEKMLKEYEKNKEDILKRLLNNQRKNL